MSSETPLTIRTAAPADDDALITLWHACGLTRPWNDPIQDLARARSESSTRILCVDAPVATPDRPLAGSVIVGYDGHRGWLYYLAVIEAWRGRHLGAALVEAARRHLIALGCPKLMLMVRTGQPGLEAYYESLGFERNPVRVYGERLIPDTET